MVHGYGRDCDGSTHISEWGNDGLQRAGGQNAVVGKASVQKEVRGAQGALREFRAAGAIFLEEGGRCRGRCCREGHKVSEGGGWVC